MVEFVIRDKVCYRAGFRGGAGGPGPRPPIIEGPPTKLLILFLANESADDFFIDASLQFASVTMY